MYMQGEFHHLPKSVEAWVECARLQATQQAVPVHQLYFFKIADCSAKHNKLKWSSCYYLQSLACTGNVHIFIRLGIENNGFGLKLVFITSSVCVLNDCWKFHWSQLANI